MKLVVQTFLQAIYVGLLMMLAVVCMDIFCPIIGVDVQGTPSVLLFGVLTMCFGLGITAATKRIYFAVPAPLPKEFLLGVTMFLSLVLAFIIGHAISPTSILCRSIPSAVFFSGISTMYMWECFQGYQFWFGQNTAAGAPSTIRQ